MKVVGLTGGIGTGKSTVAKIFESLGALVIDSDKIAKEYLSIGRTGYTEVIKRYGQGILNRHNDIDRYELARTIFKDDEEKKWLEQLIHPYVFKEIRSVIERYKDRKGVIIIDVPLLYETGAENWLKPVIVVACNQDIQIKRIHHRNEELTYKDIADRIHAQMPIEDKLKRADFVIDNSGDFAETALAVNKIWKIINQGEVL
jgi:dephospho-CoA kinase